MQHCRAVVATWGATWVEKAYNSTQKFKKKTLKMQNSSVVFNESIFDFDNFQIQFLDIDSFADDLTNAHLSTFDTSISPTPTWGRWFVDSTDSCNR